VKQRWLQRLWIVFELGLMLLIVAACRPATATPPHPTDSGVTPVPQTVQTLTALPSETPAVTATPEQGKVALLAPSGSDAGKVLALQELLAPPAQQAGLIFETLETLPADPSLRLVVALPPDPGLLNLAAANPQVKFLAVGLTGVQAAQNISVVASGGERPDQQGFLAGYLSAVVTPDWRVGVVSAPSSLAGKAARNGFSKGLTFYCGLCRPAYPPFVQYPVFADLPEGFGGPELQAAIDLLTANAVKTVYLAPGVGDTAFVESLAQAGFQIIGGGDPPASATSNWIATVRSDETGAVVQALERLLAGEDALAISTPLALTGRNEALFSAGRQRVVDGILNDLLNGYIDTGIDPQTGEPRG
jgi:hypothetical protein